MSLLLVCLFVLLKQEVSQTNLRSVINGIIICNLAYFFVSTIPLPYPRWFGPLRGHPSDGLQLFRLLRGK